MAATAELTNSELYRLAAAGDRDASEIILARLEGIIRQHAQKLAAVCRGRGLGVEDLAQEGRLAALLAIRRYKPSKSKQSTYFWYRIHGAMLSAIRSSRVAEPMDSDHIQKLDDAGRLEDCDFFYRVKRGPPA